MSAMNWLVRQLAWEQRLVELRTGGATKADLDRDARTDAETAKAA